MPSLQREQSLTGNDQKPCSTATRILNVQEGLEDLRSQFSEFKHAVEDELMEMKHSAEATRFVSICEPVTERQSPVSQSQSDMQRFIPAAIADLEQTQTQKLQEVRASAQQDFQAFMQQEQHRKMGAKHSSGEAACVSSQVTVADAVHSPRLQLIASDQALSELKRTVATLQSDLDEQRKLIGSLVVKLENIASRDESTHTGDKISSVADLYDAAVPTNRYCGLEHASDSAVHEETVVAETQQASAEGGSVNEFSWGATVWEAPIFVWLPELGFFPSLSLLLAMALNILIQAYFCFVLLTDEQFTGQRHFADMLPYLKKWRVKDGHHHKHVDSEDISLVSRVCNADPSLSLAGAQMSLLEEINAYFSMDSFELEARGFPTGPTLCVMGITYFALLIIREMRQVTFLVISLCMLPHRGTDLTEGCFLAVSHTRFYVSLVLCMIRMIFATALLISGILWLSSTSSTQDLILNAAALGFVMDIDEMLFVTLAPERGVQLVKSLQPLRFPKIPTIVDAFLPLAFLGMIVLLAYVQFVSPNLSDMLDIKRELCGGQVDFTYDMHIDLNLVMSRPTRIFEDPDMGTATSMSRAVSELKDRKSPVVRSFPETFTDMDPADTTQFSLHFPDVDTFEYALRMDIQRWAEEWTGEVDCYNHAGFGSWFNAVSYMTEISAEQLGRPVQCSDFLSFCNDRGFDTLRLICPITCGCDNHASGLYLADSVAGCPVLLTMTASAKRYSMQCVDVDLSLSVARESWNRYWQGFEGAERRGHWTDAKDTLLRNIRTHGCHVPTIASLCDMPSVQSFCPCQQSTPIAAYGGISIMGFCPATCCKIMNISEGCPLHCNTTTNDNNNVEHEV